MNLMGKPNGGVLEHADLPKKYFSKVGFEALIDCPFQFRQRSEGYIDHASSWWKGDSKQQSTGAIQAQSQ